MSNKIEILIPKLIRRIRQERALSQEDLAHKAGLDRTYISAIERGVRNITIKSLSKILVALELDIDMFSAELMYENRRD
jgi:transcriptional regulator with XRE-family HTH domain